MNTISIMIDFYFVKINTAHLIRHIDRPAVCFKTVNASVHLCIWALVQTADSHGEAEHLWERNLIRLARDQLERLHPILPLWTDTRNPLTLLSKEKSLCKNVHNINDVIIWIFMKSNGWTFCSSVSEQIQCVSENTLDSCLDVMTFGTWSQMFLHMPSEDDANRSLKHARILQ